jgi:hypothetical protein
MAEGSSKVAAFHSTGRPNLEPRRHRVRSVCATLHRKGTVSMRIGISLGGIILILILLWLIF